MYLIRSYLNNCGKENCSYWTVQILSNPSFSEVPENKKFKIHCISSPDLKSLVEPFQKAVQQERGSPSPARLPLPATAQTEHRATTKQNSYLC